MDKDQILRHLTEQLQRQLASMRKAARRTHEAATGPEAKQEGKYDTRGLEASYLAEAQAEQSQQMAESLHILANIDLKDIPPGEPITSGALVETESQGDFHYYLLIPCAGGLSMPYEGSELTTLSPDSPLYQKLIGCHVGDMISDTLVLDVH